MTPPFRVRRVCMHAVGGSGLLLAAGCSTGPKPLPTLLVTNATCSTGTCRTLQIRAFVNAFNVPGQPQDGFEVIGYARGETGCLTFPRRWLLAISSAGTGNTVWETWTPASSTGIEVYALDSAISTSGGTAAQRDSVARDLWPFVDGVPGIVGYTGTFVPGSAPGWSVTFPTTSRNGAAEPGLTATTTSCSPTGA